MDEPPVLPPDPLGDEPDAPAELLPRFRRERQALYRSLGRWRIAAIVLGAALLLTVGWAASRDPMPAEATAANPAAAVAAASGSADAADAYKTDQAKAELKLLRQALDAATEVEAHHRHHSEVMWELLQGKITAQEAWWQGGDSTCAGWLAANAFEEAVGKLKGQQAQPPPIPKQGLTFCKAARERK
jgi:hypothetical protein